MRLTGLVGLVTSSIEPIALPLTRLEPVSWFTVLMNYAPIKALVPVPILLVIAPALFWFFKGTWRDIDREAAALRAREVAADGTPLPDYRPAACLVIAAVVLTVQEYYGGRQFFYQSLRSELALLDQSWPWLRFEKYDELYGYGWWVFARVLGYVLVPLPLWKLLFPKDSLLDLGLRGRGFVKHLWIYGLCLGFVLPTMLIVASQGDFGSYYPFYKKSARSWFDFLAWEGMYFAQFFALELFFRGWMVGALRRSLGSAAIFVMSVPYCMIHYGKPYLEAHGAIVAGIVLGSLAMRTRSIYSGFLLHITVAVGMDLLALYKRDALPQTFWASG
jgi:membrane protease YdiL (CAAX protease family)